MKPYKKVRPLSDTATELKRKRHLANLKQIYGLRKDLSEIKHSIEDIAVKIDLKYANLKYS